MPWHLGVMRRFGDGQWWWLHNSVNYCHWLAHLKMAKMVTFMLCIFHHYPSPLPHKKAASRGAAAWGVSWGAAGGPGLAYTLLSASTLRRLLTADTLAAHFLSEARLSVARKEKEVLATVGKQKEVGGRNDSRSCCRGRRRGGLLQPRPSPAAAQG